MLSRLTGYRCRFCRTWRKPEDIINTPKGAQCKGPCPRPCATKVPLRRKLALC